MTVRVSVVVPVRDGAEHLARALDSILAQTTPAAEVIVVDDGSTDATAAVLEGYARARGVIALTADGVGPAAARNAGARRASGDALAFLDADDLAAPGWLEHLAGALAPGDAGLASCGYTLAGTTGASSVLPSRLGPAYGQARACPLAGTFAVRADVWRDIGGYDEQLAFSENTDLVMRAAERSIDQGLAVRSIDRSLVTVNRSEVRRPYDAARLAAGERMLERHARAYRLDPSARADVLAVMGVSAARLGRLGSARGLFLRAVAARPGRVRSYGRAALTLIPPLAGRVWRRSGRSS